MGARHRPLLLLALSLGVLLVGIELMITAVALPAIVNDIADWTRLREASWIINGYLVAYVATMPLAGRAADRYPIPGLFSLSLLVFAAGSLLAGAAQTLEMLVAARVLQGVGGGALVPLATAGASHLYDGDGRARALGAIGAATFLGMALGPFLGTTILQALDLGPAAAAAGLAASGAAGVLAPSWRWVFYLGVPFAFLAAVYAWAAAPAWPRGERGGRLDLLGAVLFTTAVAAGLVSLTWLGTDGGRISTPLGLLAIAATALAVGRFATTHDPFVELRFFRERTFAGAVLLSLLTGYALATAIIGAAVFVDRVHYGGPDEQRLVLGTLAGAMAVGALVSGFALHRLGVVLVSVVGIGLAAAGLAGLAVARTDSALEVLVGACLVFGLGFGLTVTARSAAAVDALGRRAFGLASAAVTVARMIGMAVGLAVLTALGSSRIEALSVVLTDAAARDAVLPPELQGRPLQDGLVVDVLERWAAGEAATILSSLFAVAAVVTLAGLLPAVAMRGRRTTHAVPGHTAARRDDDSEIAPAL